VHIEAETDRVYLDTEQAVQLFDPAGKRCVRVEKHNSRTTVVWNPWIQNSIKLKDLGADQWKHFVCVETCNVAPFPAGLPPAGSPTMAAVVSVTPPAEFIL